MTKQSDNAARYGTAEFAERLTYAEGVSALPRSLDLDEVLDEAKHGEHCLHCHLKTVIRDFRAEHPDGNNNIIPTIAAVLGDRFADDWVEDAAEDFHDLNRWIQQRIVFVQSRLR